MLAICEKCKRRFEVKLQEHYLGAMYSETYITCPSCNEKYIIAITNKKVRHLKDIVDIKRKKYHRLQDSDSKEEFSDALKEFKKELNKINGK